MTQAYNDNPAFEGDSITLEEIADFNNVKLSEADKRFASELQAFAIMIGMYYGHITERAA